MLGPYVDKFIIVEAKTTFSGNKKPLYFSLHEKYVMPWWNKISYQIIDETYSPEELALAHSSPNTVGAKHWKREFLQKESIKKFLVHLNDEDIVYIGDVDEIWDHTYLPQLLIEKLLLHVYVYKLDNKSSEVFWGPIVGKWGDIKLHCLNHLRSEVSIRGLEYGGWHFTNMGGFKEVKRKLHDSYTANSYNTPEVQKLLQTRIEMNQDYLGRSFTYSQDVFDWPPYLRQNRSKYTKLIH